MLETIGAIVVVLFLLWLLLPVILELVSGAWRFFGVLIAALLLGAVASGLLTLAWVVCHRIPGGDTVFGLGVLALVWLFFFDSLTNFTITKVLWQSARHFAKRTRPAATSKH